MSAYFVTATGTDIGKTFVTVGLVRHLRESRNMVSALKPVMSGFTWETAAASDAGVLLAALDLPVTEENVRLISPWRFTAPLSPDMAAAREDRHIDFDALVTWCRRAVAANPGTLFIEGVGGVMVPLDARRTVLDWMAALDLPLIMVTGSYLGALSHTLTALDAVARRGLTVAVLVVNESTASPVPLADMMATLRRFAPGVPVVSLSRMLTCEVSRL